MTDTTDYNGLVERLIEWERGWSICSDERGLASADIYEAAAAITTLIGERDALRREADQKSSDWAQFCVSIGADLDSHEAVADAIVTRIFALEKAEKALEPFAEAALDIPEHFHDLVPVVLVTDEEGNAVVSVHIGDFRRALHGGK